MRREFFYQDDRSNKIWTVECRGAEVITTHGRVGAAPRETRKVCADEAAAQREAGKLAASKLAKGYVEGRLDDIPAYQKPDWSAMSMSEEVFWRLLRLLNWRRLGDDEAVIEPVVAALAAMNEADIKAFEDLLAAKLHLLDTKAIAAEIGEDAWQPGKHFSADWFLYARCAVVANGPDLLAEVLADPKAMPKDVEFEVLLTIAPTAYERRTGRPFEHVSPVSYETFTNRAGWA